MKHKSKLIENLIVTEAPKQGLRADTQDGEIVLSTKKNEHGEYTVRLMVNGREEEKSTYYTDDWDDAVGTFNTLKKTIEGWGK